MSRFLFILLSIFASTSLMSQEVDTAQIHRQVRHVPKPYTKHPAYLAQYLTQDYTDDASKVMVISYWIARHIRYNYKAYVNRKILGWDSKKVLRKRKALCGEYAQLFKEMCTAVGVEAEIVNGYTRPFDLFPDDKLYRAEHAWSVVKINGLWHLLDITWASGFARPRKQWGSRLLWRFFKIPYEQKFRYIHELNTSWMFVHPEKMIFSHFPVMDDFQLLRQAMPIEHFIQGKASIEQYWREHRDNAAQRPYINQYIGLEDVSKKLIEADRSRQSNAANHRLTSLNYVYAANKRARQLAERKAKGMEISMQSMNLIRSYQWTADSFRVQSQKDNREEFRIKDARSKRWYKILETENRILIDSLRIRNKENLRQLNLIRRTRSQRKAHQRLGTRSLSRWSKHSMRRIRRPKKVHPKNANRKFQELSKADDLRKEALALLPVCDSLYRFPNTEEHEEAQDVERIVSDLYGKNREYMNEYLDGRRRSFDHIYWDERPLYKAELHSMFYLADSLNRTYVGHYLQQMYDNPRAAYKVMLKYRNLQDKRMRHIVRAKRLSVESIGEDELFEEARLEYVAAFKQYLHYDKTYYGSQRLIRRKLIGERRGLRKLSDKLYHDIRLERIRYRTYRRYRLLIQKGENRRLRYFFS